VIFSRSYLQRARLQKLHSFGPDWYVFRDDELSFSISGSKVRKYSTLLPYLLDRDIKHVVVIGGSSSNNVCGLCQLVIENGMTPHIFTLEHRGELQGNALLISLMIPEERNHIVPREKWDDVERIANEYAMTLESAIVIPEGANHPAAYDGAKTLAEDIARVCSPDHVFIDAGTGMQAKAVIDAGKKFLPNTHFHVVLVAGSPFEAGSNVTFYKPSVGASFGSTPKAILQETKKIAQDEGFFVDPIYTAKLFYTAREQTKLEGVKCIVHSGGGIGIFPYAEKLEKTGKTP